MKRFILGDCMNEENGLPTYPNNYFNLAIVDPPYGIGEDGKKNHSRDKLAKAKKYVPKNWDKQPPNKEYFKELFRVSKNQIIFGANHFIENFPYFNSSCWIVWDKDNTGDFADCELAWTSFNTAVRKFKFRWNGMIQEDMKNKEIRIHPTQKPVKLYSAIIDKYAKKGDLIVDTHVGSASSLIAFESMGFDYIAFEKDKDYYLKAKNRMAKGIPLVMF